MGIYIFYLIFFIVALLASTELVRHSRKKRGKLLETNRAMQSDGTRTDLTSTNRMRVKQIVSQVGNKRAESNEVTCQEEAQASDISLDNGEEDLPDPFVSSAKLPKSIH